MRAASDEIAVLVCLPADELDAESVLSAAAALARDLSASLCVVRIYPSKSSRSEQAPARTPEPTWWHLQTDDPTQPLLTFARQHRITHLVLSQRASELWGASLARAAEAAGRLSLSWLVPGCGARGMSFESF